MYYPFYTAYYLENFTLLPDQMLMCADFTLKKVGEPNFTDNLYFYIIVTLNLAIINHFNVFIFCM